MMAETLRKQTASKDRSEFRYGEISEQEARLRMAARLRSMYGPQPCRQETGYCHPENGDCYNCLAAMGELCRATQ
jgi:hypothetical protein